MPKLVAIPARPTLRMYLRRSKGDVEQTHSLDVQRAGCTQFADTLAISFAGRVEYIDDDRAGDDFLGRKDLQRLLKEALPGDVVICRDQSRIGRKATLTTGLIEELVQERRARLFYYVDRREVTMTNALDSAMVFVPGIGHQMELEANRSRTAEALRARVGAGKLAGGRCYGYRNVQNPDPDGRRKNTVAVIHIEQAKVVVQIFTWYAEGRGLVWIAKTLNGRHVPSPSHGTRGTGSWAPSAIRSILKNERYRGLYIHGRTDRPRKGGKRLTIKADESKIIRVEMPEWRIVPEALWQKVAARFAAQAHLAANKGNPWRAGAPKHPLSGLGRCANCGGPITVTITKRGQKSIQSYSCAYAVKRGATVCTVSIRQPRDVVEGAIVRHLLDHTLSPEIIKRITARVVELAQQERGDEAVPVDRLEEELARLRTEQKRCAQLLARLDDAGELEAEFSVRTAKIRAMKDTIAAAKAAPAAAQVTLETLKGEIAAAFERLRQGLVAAPEELGRVLRSLFTRLNFEPEGNHWAVSGSPRVALDAATSSICDPSGIRTRVHALKGHCPGPG